ncbi:MAG TPA: cytochrome c oxidase subunit 4, partial [Acidimicrobiales bacterium]
EGPRGHEVRQPVDDAAVPWRVFAAVGLFGLLLAVVYWFTSYEEAGSALLAVAGVLSLWCGVYLWLQHRPPRAAPADARTAGRPAEPAGTAGYLPHASVWPFVIGVGAATVLNGLVLGTWVILPGALLLVLGLGGFVAQTRRRD